HTERGTFAGIFGFMINLGRFGIFTLGPALLDGFTFLGLIRVPPLHWRWLFWVPAGITLVVGTCMALIVRDTPEEANFPPVNPDEETDGRVHVKVFDVLKIIATNPVIWIVACAYACTGSVRQGIDQCSRVSCRKRITSITNQRSFNCWLFQFLLWRQLVRSFLASFPTKFSGAVAHRWRQVSIFLKQRSFLSPLNFIPLTRQLFFLS